MKKVLLAIAVVMFVAGTAFGSATELDSLGGIPAQYTTTDQVVEIYPSLIGDFKNRAVVDFDGDISGYTMFDTEFGVFGLSAGSFPNVFSAEANTDLTEFSPLSLPDTAVGVQYGTELEGMKVGASLLFGSYVSSTKTADPDSASDPLNEGEHAFELTLGATLEGEMPIDVSLSIANAASWDIEETYYFDNGDGNLETATYDENGGLGIGLNARTAIDSWLVNLGFNFDSVNAKRTEEEDTDDDGELDINTVTEATDSEMSLNLGLAHVLKASDTLTITMGSMLFFATDTDYQVIEKNFIADTETYEIDSIGSGYNYYIPLFIAVEANLNETWSIRGGITSVVLASQQTDTTDVASDGEETADDTNGSILTDIGLVTGKVGVTGTIGDLKLDLDLNPALLLDGPNFISGRNNDLAASMAVNYMWGN